MRGAGKTFWWSALQDPYVRGLVGEQAGRLPSRDTTVLNENTVVRAGFGERPALDRYPNKDVVVRMMKAGVDPRTIWRTVQAWQLLESCEEDHPLRQYSSWEERTRYVANHPEATERFFQDRDDEFEWKGIYFLILFDALDRCADEWSDMYRAIRGLLQTTLELRSYRWLRAKVFLRSDQAEESKVVDFPDSSKVLAAAVELNWPRHELYGLLWHCLVNGASSDVFHRLLAENPWTPTIVNDQKLYAVPRQLVADESRQREAFSAISGPFMGRDRRRGIPYTWITNHLEDTRGRASPRSFLAALRTAAADTTNRQPEHGYALHYESIKRGVREASRIRIRELQEDYPWVHTVLESLKGMVVPCTFDAIAGQWRRDRILERLASDVSRDGRSLPPQCMERGTDGVRDDSRVPGRLHANAGRPNQHSGRLQGWDTGSAEGVE